MKLLFFLFLCLFSSNCFSLDLGEKPKKYTLYSFLELASGSGVANKKMIKVSAYLRVSPSLSSGYIYFSESSFLEHSLVDSIYLGLGGLDISEKCKSAIFGKRVYVYGVFDGFSRKEIDNTEGLPAMDNDYALGAIFDVDYIEAPNIEDKNVCSVSKAPEKSDQL